MFVELGKKTFQVSEEAGSAVRRDAPPVFPWRETASEAVISTTRANIKSRYSELFDAAKHGDKAAAASLVARVVKAERTAAVASSHPDAIVVYPHERRKTTNRLAEAYAEYFSRYGLSANRNIEQVIRPHHTGVGDIDRLLLRSRYEGTVSRGSEYIIADDHISSGASVRDLKDFIESRGGRVVAVTALTASLGGTKLRPSVETMEKLREAGITDVQLQKLGIARGMEGMTNAECRRILRFATSRQRQSAILNPDTGKVEDHARTYNNMVHEIFANGQESARSLYANSTVPLAVLSREQHRTLPFGQLFIRYGDLSKAIRSGANSAVTEKAWLALSGRLGIGSPYLVLEDRRTGLYRFYTEVSDGEGNFYDIVADCHPLSESKQPDALLVDRMTALSYRLADGIRVVISKSDYLRDIRSIDGKAILYKDSRCNAALAQGTIISKSLKWNSSQPSPR